MSYLVLARKYRSQRFSELVGQEHVARTLSNAIAQNRVHHAFLFTGARGVGKTSAARILAKALSCEKGPTPDPCGVCEMCVEITTGRSVDVVEIDGASNTGVDDVRVLREGVRYMPAKARRKITIIDEVHMLSTSAFNALLKTLEEPPPHAVFIFATTEVHKIPTTILSRCQRYDFKLIPTERLVKHLAGILEAERIGFEEEGLRVVARQAAGSARDALSLLDQVIAYVGEGERITRAIAAEVLGVADQRLLVELAGAALAGNAAEVLRTLARAADAGLDLGQLAKSFLAFLRDLEVARRVPDPADLIDATADELAEIRGLAGRAEERVLGVMFDRWARAVDEASRSSAPRLIYEMALVDLCYAEPLEPLGDLLERLEDLEARLSGHAPAGGRPERRPAPRAEGDAAGATGMPPSSGAVVAGGAASVSATMGTGAELARPLAPSREALVASPEEVREVRAVAGGASVAAAAGAFAGGAAVATAWIPTASVAPAEPASSPAPEKAPLAAVIPMIRPTVDGPETSDEQAVRAGWAAVKSELEKKRPSIGALLAHAHVAALDGSKITLAFGDRGEAERAEKVRGELEQALVRLSGRTVRVAVVQDSGIKAPAISSDVVSEARALNEDRKKRELEARRHPLVQKAQDVFGVPIREIKT
jgi:DNA polymerase-3 subunit gamma/tau